MACRRGADQRGSGVHGRHPRALPAVFRTGGHVRDREQRSGCRCISSSVRNGRRAASRVFELQSNPLDGVPAPAKPGAHHSSPDLVSDAFTRAAAVLFNNPNLSVAAVYSLPNGASLPVRVIRRDTEGEGPSRWRLRALKQHHVRVADVRRCRSGRWNGCSISIGPEHMERVRHQTRTSERAYGS